MDAAEFDAWFSLLATPGVGRGTARRLIAACGTPEAVLATPLPTLRQLAGEAVAQALKNPADETEARREAARAWLAGGSDRHAIAPGDPRFPPALLQSADPPLLLYVQGDPAVLQRPALAIVGSRSATPQGLANARAFARELAAQGWCIVSGLALGIDAAAHEGALEATGGAGTVAVVGTGLDRVFPARHRALAHRIAAAGALVSEYAPGTPPLREHFPERNRIIAGLAQGTLVVEAALASGSLITARLASEAGREVFAIPGSIHSPQARGCHALIRQGAKLVETAEDIVEELRGQRPLALAAAPGDATAAADGDPLLAALGHDPVTLDALLARTGESAAALSARLLELELEGRVARLPGGLYQRLFSG
jgi:DNA processing protein